MLGTPYGFRFFDDVLELEASVPMIYEEVKHEDEEGSKEENRGPTNCKIEREKKEEINLIPYWSDIFSLISTHIIPE